MADEITTPEEQPQEPAAATPAPETLGEPGKAALDAERKARREADRQLKETLARLKELEDRDKSEVDRLRERAEAAEKAATEAALKALRADVATEMGVPAALLSGQTEEELRASAAALLEFRGKTPAAPPANGVQGGVGAPINGGASQLTRDQLRGMSPEAITKAKAEGRLNQLLGINT